MLTTGPFLEVSQRRPSRQRYHRQGRQGESKGENPMHRLGVHQPRAGLVNSRQDRI